MLYSLYLQLSRMQLFLYITDADGDIYNAIWQMIEKILYEFSNIATTNYK